MIVHKTKQFSPYGLDKKINDFLKDERSKRFGYWRVHRVIALDIQDSSNLKIGGIDTTILVIFEKDI